MAVQGKGAVRGLCILVSAALLLAGCADTRVTLGPAPTVSAAESVVGGAPEAAIVVPPQPQVDNLIFEDDPGSGETEGYVRMRYGVTESGAVRDVEVIESSDRRLEEPALRLMLNWPHSAGTVDGAPAAFERLEADVTFFQEPGVIDTPKENVLVGLAIAGAVAIVVIISLTTGADVVSN